MTTSNLDLPSSVPPPLEISQFHHTPYYCEENVYLLCKKLQENRAADAEGSDLFVVFISNEKKQASLGNYLSAPDPIHLCSREKKNHSCSMSCYLWGSVISEDLYHELKLEEIPLWHQKASHRADGVILWDYHVICIQRKKDGTSSHLVWDLDSSLPFPSPLATYVSETIRPSFELFSEFQRFFRIVHAPIFLRSFASDRRHMKDSVGNWISQPPAYEAMVAEDGTVHNLNQYNEISTADMVKNVGTDSTDSVFTQKFGVLVSESQLEEYFSMLS